MRNQYIKNLFLGLRTDGTTFSSASLTSPTTDTPCALSTSIALTEYCVIQKITNPSGSAGSFGSVLGALPGNVQKGLTVPKDSISICN